jgi:hypothetical protein
MGSMQEQSINMPSYNEYIEPIVARSGREQDFLRTPPYPLHSQDIDRNSASTIHCSLNRMIRQPTAEDFLRPDHPLPAPPPEVYNSDQDLPVIEPDSYLHEDFNNEHELQQPSASVPERYPTTASVKPHFKLELRLNNKRSQSEHIRPSHVPAPTYESTISEHHTTPIRVPAIGVDMYQPALGGLQTVSGIQRSNSKRDRIKRFMSGLNPFHRVRKFGRQQRG